MSDPKVFISYRRDDSSGHTGRLYDRLARTFGKERLFLDIDNIAPGADFTEVINETLAVCGVMLVIVGPHWISGVDESGRRRIDQAHDLHRQEIEAGLSRGLLTIPILVGGARMPAPSELPESLRGFTTRNAFELSDKRFDFDTSKLVATIADALHVPAAVTTSVERPATANTRAGRYVLIGSVLVLVLAGLAWRLVPSGSTQSQEAVSDGEPYVAPPSIEAVRTEYDRMKASALEYRVHHILLDDANDAAAVIAQLQHGASFEVVAKAKSRDRPSAENGGDLGFAPATSYPPEFVAAVGRLAPGETTAAPVRTRFGFHIIRLDARRNAAFPQFEEMKDSIEARLRARR